MPKFRSVGNSNQAYQYQYGTDAGDCSYENNWADIYQLNGNSNYARQDQSTEQNTAVTTQNGSNNWNYDKQWGWKLVTAPSPPKPVPAIATIIFKMVPETWRM